MLLKYSMGSFASINMRTHDKGRLFCLLSLIILRSGGIFSAKINMSKNMHTEDKGRLLDI